MEKVPWSLLRFYINLHTVPLMEYPNLQLLDVVNAHERVFFSNKTQYLAKYKIIRGNFVSLLCSKCPTLASCVFIISMHLSNVIYLLGSSETKKAAISQKRSRFPIFVDKMCLLRESTLAPKIMCSSQYCHC